MAIIHPDDECRDGDPRFRRERRLDRCRHEGPAPQDTVGVRSAGREGQVHLYTGLPGARAKNTGRITQDPQKYYIRKSLLIIIFLVIIKSNIKVILWLQQV